MVEVEAVHRPRGLGAGGRGTRPRPALRGSLRPHRAEGGPADAPAREPRGGLHLRRPAAQVRARRLRRDRSRPVRLRGAARAGRDRPGRGRDRAPPAGRGPDGHASASTPRSTTVRGSSRPTPASKRPSTTPASTGPWDAFVAVGGGSAIDTAKAVDLMCTNPGEILDYVNAPVGGGRAPEHPLAPLVAVPTTTGTGSESTTICVLDVRRPAGQDRDQPPAAATHARRRRPAADPDPAGRCHGGRGDGHLVPRPGVVDGPSLLRLRAQAARPAGALLRRQPDRRHVGRARAASCSRRRSGPPSSTGTTRTPVSRCRWPPPSQGWASATPACTSRTPTPTQSPVRCATSTRSATPTTTRWCRTAWRSP